MNRLIAFAAAALFALPAFAQDARRGASAGQQLMPWTSQLPDTSRRTEPRPAERRGQQAYVLMGGGAFSTETANGHTGLRGRMTLGLPVAPRTAIELSGEKAVGTGSDYAGMSIGAGARFDVAQHLYAQGGLNYWSLEAGDTLDGPALTAKTIGMAGGIGTQWTSGAASVRVEWVGMQAPLGVIESESRVEAMQARPGVELRALTVEVGLSL